MSLLDRIRSISLRPSAPANDTTELKSVAITDEGPWDTLLSAGGGPADRTWYDVAQDLDDALEAWRKNFLIRQIVRLTTAFVVGDGIRIKVEHPMQAVKFTQAFWSHRQNLIDRRLSAWCDELTRSGELFIALFTNPMDGMSYIRTIPARQIEQVETDPEDYEKETGYQERIPGQVKPKYWPALDPTPTAAGVQQPPTPVLLHYSVNKPVGATRGESDLTPILPWVKRYSDWLKDRVRFNKVRTEMAAAWIKIQDDSQVERKRKQYEANPPTGGNIFVTGPGEELKFPASTIQGYDSEPDGKALRLAIAAGANIPLHFLAEGSSATKSTAEAMGDPTQRHFRMRQKDFCYVLVDLVEKAYIRHCQVRGIRRLIDIQATAETPDISREDNESLANAAKTIVEAFSTMTENGWIDNETAIRLSFKFAGEVLPDEKIQQILANGWPPK